MAAYWFNQLPLSQRLRGFNDDAEAKGLRPEWAINATWAGSLSRDAASVACIDAQDAWESRAYRALEQEEATRR